MLNTLSLKRQARLLHQSLTKKGFECSIAQSYELLAEQHGLPTWDALSGMVKQAENEAKSRSTRCNNIILPNVNLLILTSCDGAPYDLHVLVPAELHPSKISEMLAIKINKLKKLNSDEDQETAALLREYCTEIGCRMIDEVNICSENWD